MLGCYFANTRSFARPLGLPAASKRMLTRAVTVTDVTLCVTLQRRNAMIHPLIQMRFKGAIWYQGEANDGEYDSYCCRFPALIADWRKKMGRCATSKPFSCRGSARGHCWVASWLRPPIHPPQPLCSCEGRGHCWVASSSHPPPCSFEGNRQRHLDAAA